MPFSRRLFLRKAFATSLVAGALAVAGGSMAQTLPQGGFAAASGGARPDAAVSVDHFKAICSDPDGDETAALTAMQRLNYVELAIAPGAEYASVEYQLLVDIDSEAGAIATCRVRAMTHSPASDFEARIASVAKIAPMSATVELSDVEYFDQTLGLRPTNTPFEMNSTDLNAITIIWSAPLSGRPI